MRVMCLAQENNTISLARAQTRAAQSEEELTNHKATALPKEKHKQITTSYFSETYCGGNLTSMTGNITSPNHPDPYPKGIECIWHIKCPEGRGLLMLIPNISLPLTKDCSDHLIMRENASPFSRTTYYACESYANPVSFISRSKDLYIKLTSKSSNAMAAGFKIFYVTFEGKLFLF